MKNYRSIMMVLSFLMIVLLCGCYSEEHTWVTPSSSQTVVSNQDNIRPIIVHDQTEKRQTDEVPTIRVIHEESDFRKTKELFDMTQQIGTMLQRDGYIKK